MVPLVLLSLLLHGCFTPTAGVYFLSSLSGHGEEAYNTSTSSYMLYARTAMISVTGVFRMNRKPSAEECIMDCDAESSKCKSLNIRNTGMEGAEKFACYYFDTVSKWFVENENTTFVRKDEEESTSGCDPFCSRLSYMNLCGACECVDICFSRYSHYCNCTKAFERTFKDCNEIVETGSVVAGVYLFDWNSLDDGDIANMAVEGFCQHPHPEYQSLSLILFRRIMNSQEDDSAIFLHKTLDHYIEGFGKPFHQSYWLGLTHAHKLTTSRDCKLFVIATTVENNVWIGEYHGFQIVKNGLRQYAATYKYYTSIYGLVDPFQGADQLHNFSKCNMSEHAVEDDVWWFGDCGVGGVRSAPTAGKGAIRWGDGVYEGIILLINTVKGEEDENTNEWIKPSTESPSDCLLENKKFDGVQVDSSVATSWTHCASKCRVHVTCKFFGYVTTTTLSTYTDTNCYLLRTKTSEERVADGHYYGEQTCGLPQIHGGMILLSKSLYLGTVDVLGRSFSIQFFLYTTPFIQTYPSEFLSITNPQSSILRLYNYNEVLRIKSLSFAEMTTNLIASSWMKVELVQMFTGEGYSMSLLVDDRLVDRQLVGQPGMYENQRVYATTTNSDSEDAIIDKLFINGKQYFDPNNPP